MPAPKSLKRRKEDEHSPGPSRRTKKQGKNKREVTYDTYDEALDGGVEMEEKGERYRDGDKAQRFYEKALDLYKTAYDFCPTFDSAYNQARVLFTLSTSFFLPPTSLSYLTTSVQLYRHSTTLTEDALLSLDAGYNLSQALLELAEVIEDLHSDRDEEVRNLRVEAAGLLAQVMDSQETYLRQQTVSGEAAIEEIQPPSEQAKKGDNEVEVMEVDAESAEKEQASSGSGDDEDDDRAFETHLPTYSTFIDTCLLLLDTHLTLWTTLEPPTIPSTPDQTIVRSILDKAAAMTPVGRQAEIDFGEIKVLLALDEIVWRMHKSEARGSSTEQQSLEKAVAALQSLLHNIEVKPPDEPTIKAEVLMFLSDVHKTLAQRSMYLSASVAVVLPGQPSPLGQKAWYHLGESIGILNQAMELPTAPGQPKTFKPSILLSLSQASLLRARLAKINDTAMRNAGQLMENALNYIVRAGESIGWGWINPSRLEYSAKQVNPNKIELPYPSGWDTEVLARDITLQLLRVCHFATSDEVLCSAVGDKVEKYGNVARGVRERLKGLEGERKVTGRDIERYKNDLEEEDDHMTEAEVAWWQDCVREL